MRAGEAGWWVCCLAGWFPVVDHLWFFFVLNTCFAEGMELLVRRRKMNIRSGSLRVVLVYIVIRRDRIIIPYMSGVLDFCSDGISVDLVPSTYIR